MELRLLKRYISSLNIFIWGVALCCHAACKNFAGLLVVRLILGMCEGSITAGFLIVSSMFYTRREQTARVGYWCKGYDSHLSPPCLTSNRFNEWNRFESHFSLFSQTTHTRRYSCSYRWFYKLWHFAHTHHRIEALAMVGQVEHLTNANALTFL